MFKNMRFFYGALIEDVICAMVLVYVSVSNAPIIDTMDFAKKLRNKINKAKTIKSNNLR